MFAVKQGYEAPVYEVPFLSEEDRCMEGLIGQTFVRKCAGAIEAESNNNPSGEDDGEGWWLWGYYDYLSGDELGDVVDGEVFLYPRIASGDLFDALRLEAGDDIANCVESTVGEYAGLRAAEEQAWGRNR